MKHLALAAVFVATPVFAQMQMPAKPLLERSDVVSWKTFDKVELVRQKDRYVPNFSPDVAALDQKQVKVQGFMMPMQTEDKQSHFVLSAMPVDCAFCLPGGPEAFVEVKARTPVKYTMEPVIISGQLTVLKTEPSGVFYRLTDAVQSN